CRRQRQRISAILEQDDSLARRVARKHARSDIVLPGGGAVGVDIGMLEQTKLELGPQYACDCAVNDAVRDRATSKCGEIGRVLVVLRLKNDVQTRLERMLRRRRGVDLCVV